MLTSNILTLLTTQISKVTEASFSAESGGLEWPEDPAPNGYEKENPYTQNVADAFAYVRAEAESTDGWTNIGTNAGVLMEKKNMPGDSSAIPLVRGRGIIKGVKPYELLPIVASLSIRLQWDARYQEGHALVRYSQKSYKFYSIQKGAFLVWPRDFVGVRDAAYSEDGIIEVVQTSVPNDEKTPDVYGKVRATLTAAGWILRPSGDDTDVTYLVKVNPNGSIPTVLVNKLVTEIPLCIVKIAEFIHSFGLVCYIPQNLISSVVRMETYDHDSKTYTLALIGAAGDAFDIAVDTKTMYKNGYVTVLNDAVSGVSLSGDGSAMLHVEIGEQADGAKFSITVKKA